MKSTRTTIAGIATILSAILIALAAMFDSNPATVADWGVVFAGVSTGIGLLLARDNDKSSEDVGNSKHQ
jgi:hypothetical protein